MFVRLEQNGMELEQSENGTEMWGALYFYRLCLFFFFLTGTLQESQTSGGGRAEGVGCLNIVLKPLMLRSKILFQIAITTVNSRNWKTPHGICNTWHYHLPLSLTLTPSVNAIITHYSHFYV